MFCSMQSDARPPSEGVVPEPNGSLIYFSGVRKTGTRVGNQQRGVRLIKTFPSGMREDLCQSEKYERSQLRAHNQDRRRPEHPAPGNYETSTGRAPIDDIQNNPPVSLHKLN
ncbi:hypothetical protein MTP99_011693 [Tenebrio molitor]|nr:hypothetical protein MTP99_011693 [Tenebrio molitor]